MRNGAAFLIAGLVLAPLLIAIAFGGGSWHFDVPIESAPTPAPAPDPDPLLKKGPALPEGAEAVRIDRAADGDTAILADGRTVRYLGVDTPERDQNFHAEAARFNAGLVEKREAWLEFDVERADRHGRLLAFVWVVEDGAAKNVSLELVRSGLAYAYTPGPNARHKEELVAAQREAREQGRGFWKDYVFGRAETLVSTPNGHAFHRPGCETIKTANPDTLKRWESREAALDAGRSPCRTCKP
jgi:micrococcal nuclease